MTLKLTLVVASCYHIYSKKMPKIKKHDLSYKVSLIFANQKENTNKNCHYRIYNADIGRVWDLAAGDWELGFQLSQTNDLSNLFCRVLARQ